MLCCRAQRFGSRQSPVVANCGFCYILCAEGCGFGAMCAFKLKPSDARWTTTHDPLYAVFGLEHTWQGLCLSTRVACLYSRRAIYGECELLVGT
jgi:hypothetical protein